MLAQDEKQRFREWLKNNTNLSKKAIVDVSSRLTRVEKIMPVKAPGIPEDFLFALGKKAEFAQLGITVKSQLRRSYKLYHQFRSGQ